MIDPDVDPIYPITGKPYHFIRFRDVPPEYILGGYCILCRRRGPVDRVRVEQRWGLDTQVRQVDRYLRCLVCGDTIVTKFTVVGKAL